MRRPRDPREIPAARDWENNGHFRDAVERLRRDDQHRPPSLLFVSLGGIKSDQPGFAAIHQGNSSPAGLSSNHSRSSFLRGAFGLQWASSLSSVRLGSAPGRSVNRSAGDRGSGASGLDFRLAMLPTQVLTPSGHAQIRATSWEETNIPWPRVFWAPYELLIQAKTRSTGRRHPGTAGSASAIWPALNTVGRSGVGDRYDRMSWASGSTSQTTLVPASK